MEAVADGYSEGIALDRPATSAKAAARTSSSCATSVLYTPPLAASILPGITRDTVITLAQRPRLHGARGDPAARDCSTSPTRCSSSARPPRSRRSGRSTRSRSAPAGAARSPRRSSRRSSTSSTARSPDRHGWLTYVYPGEPLERAAAGQPRPRKAVTPPLPGCAIVPGARLRRKAAPRLFRAMHINDCSRSAVAQRRLRPPPEGRQLPDVRVNGDAGRRRPRRSASSRERHRGHGRHALQPTSSAERSSEAQEVDLAYSVPGLGPLPLQRLPAARHRRRSSCASSRRAFAAHRRARPAAGAQAHRARKSAAWCWSPAPPAAARARRWRR